MTFPDSLYDYAIPSYWDDEMAIIGVTEKGKRWETLFIPRSFDVPVPEYDDDYGYLREKVVRTIVDHAFDGCKDLREIYMGSNIKAIWENAFDGCPKLQKIHLMRDYDSGYDVNIPHVKPGLLDNVPSRVMFYVPREHYDYFLKRNNWRNYIDRIVAE